MVVTSVWGGRIYSIHCRASYFALGRLEDKDENHQDDLKNYKCILFFKIVRVKKSWGGTELNKFCPPNRSDDRYLCFYLYPSSMLTTNAAMFYNTLYTWTIWLILCIIVVQYSTIILSGELQLVAVAELPDLPRVNRHQDIWQYAVAPISNKCIIACSHIITLIS